MARRTKAEIAEERRIELQREQVALQKTLDQIPVTPDRIDWSTNLNVKNSPYDYARAFLDYIDAAIARGDTVKARPVSNNLYDVHGGHLGVYSVEVIKRIISTGKFVGAETREHPLGRERSAENLIEWRKRNPDASFEEFCVQIEPFARTTSTTPEENTRLVPFQNKGTYGVCPNWQDTYREAEIPWIYVHFPEGKNRTVGWLERVAKEMKLIQDETAKENNDGDW